MKLSAKAVSSTPSRTDSVPPTLPSFLGNNGGCRGRGRCRSSPSLIRKSSNNHVSMAQEPSSPKVTCIGQVQVNTSEQTVTKKETQKTARKRYEWIQNSLFCRFYDRKSNSEMSKPVVGKKWALWFPRRKQESIDRKGKPEQKRPTDKIEDLVPSTPPKDALLLMKCRSEAFRGSLRGSRDRNPVLEKS